MVADLAADWILIRPGVWVASDAPAFAWDGTLDEPEERACNVGRETVKAEGREGCHPLTARLGDPNVTRRPEPMIGDRRRSRKSRRKPTRDLAGPLLFDITTDPEEGS